MTNLMNETIKNINNEFNNNLETRLKLLWINKSNIHEYTLDYTKYIKQVWKYNYQVPWIININKK